MYKNNHRKHIKILKKVSSIKSIHLFINYKINTIYYCSLINQNNKINNQKVLNITKNNQKNNDFTQ